VAKRFSRLKSDIEHFGLMRSLFNRIMRRVARHLGIHINVVRIRPMADTPDYPAMPPTISLQIISPETLLEACKDPELQLNHEFVQKAIERGDFAFGAFDGSKLVTYVWRAVASAPHTENLWVRVKRPFNYAYNSFTRPSHRGQRISPAVHLFSDEEMFRQGFTHRAGFVSIANSASLAAGKHMDVDPIGYAGYLSWFGRDIPFRTRAVRNIGFEFFEPD